VALGLLQVPAGATMRLQSRNFFKASVICLAFFAVSNAIAGGHKSLNGTWTLEPTKSEFAGEPALQTGSVTINDREHNITVTRSFTYDGANESFSYSFSTDGRENSTIHQGKAFKSKAKWDDNVLKVTTTQNDVTVVERYSLEPDGSMKLMVERPGHKLISLFFQRQ
jgi:hypothetical protein